MSDQSAFPPPPNVAAPFALAAPPDVPTAEEMAARLAVLEQYHKAAEAEKQVHIADTVGKAVVDLYDHVRARRASHPSHDSAFADAEKLLADLAGRFAPPELGAPPKQAGSVSVNEAELVGGEVARLVRGRGHMELDYLPELADNLIMAVRRAEIARAAG